MLFLSFSCVAEEIMFKGISLKGKIVQQVADELKKLPNAKCINGYTYKVSYAGTDSECGVKGYDVEESHAAKDELACFIG